MRALTEKINEERIKSINLREQSWGVPYEKGVEVRKIQQEAWDKFNFFKNLDKAIEKSKRKVL